MPMMDLTSFSVALYKFRDTNDRAEPTAFCGSGFILVGGVMVTCRHCFEDYPLKTDEYYGAVHTKANGAGYTALRIEAVSFDPSGVDLATAATGLQGSPLMLTRGISGIGQDVGTIGHPGTYGRLRDETSGPLQFDQQSRWLEGYVTRGFVYERPDHKKVRSWEVDMPAPSGLSGSPLLLLRATESSPVVVGVIYGSHTVPSDLGSADAMPSGTPFALAHYLDSVQQLRGDVLGSETLAEYLERHGRMSSAVQQ